MRRSWLLLVCLGWCAVGAANEDEGLAPSTPDQVAALTGELVGGVVSPMSGQVCLRQTDLVARGAQDVELTRLYLAPDVACSFHPKPDHDAYLFLQHLRKTYRAWVFFPHVHAQVMARSVVRLTEPCGVTLDFVVSGGITRLREPALGISNAVGEIPSGKYDFRNTRIEMNDDRLVVHAVDGAVRHYVRSSRLRRYIKPYLLDREVLPNGKVLRYRYDRFDEVALVESLDPQEKHVYASIHVEGSSYEGMKSFLSSSGAVTEYRYDKRQKKGSVRDHHKRWKYDLPTPPFLARVSSPFYRKEALEYNERFLLESYSGKDLIFKCTHKGFGDGKPHYRVDKLLLPVGKQDAFVGVYEMDYRPEEGLTRVRNEDGSSVVYRFSDRLLMTRVEYFEQDGSLRKQKVLSWSDKQWLKSVEVLDGQKQLMFKKSYQYDDFGNPIVEVFAGDLLGNGEQQHATIKREFSKDGKNLLLREEYDNGKVLSFSYLPGTDLVMSKLTQDGDAVVLREAFAYDACYNLVEKSIDDGKQKTFTRYVLRQKAPFLHMPEWIEEAYSEQGSEKLLKRTHLSYDCEGNVEKEEVYDAGDQAVYTLDKKYNERGDVLAETNPLGQKATYRYTDRGRCEELVGFSGRTTCTMRYDTKGRLRKKTESANRTHAHVLSFDYDAYDRLAAKTDIFHNVTRYSYDPLTGLPISTESPAVADLDGQACKVITYASYDALGRTLTKTDALGHVASYRYNAYGSPTEIVYPNGGKESFRYDKNGRLKNHTDADGLTVRYTYDILDRVLSKAYVSAKDEVIAKESFTYDGLNLIKEKDKEGHVTEYVYDGAGRKVRESRSGKVTEFTYDGLGRLATVCENQTLVTHYKRDLLGRVIQELKTDLAGNALHQIAYSYDHDQNQETITRQVNGKAAVETFVYDDFHRVVMHRDALGNISSTVYDEDEVNGLGQKVLKIETSDPSGKVTIVTQDAAGRVAKKEVLSTKKATLSCQEMIYDVSGNLAYQRDHVGNDPQLTHFTYMPNDELETLTRAFGTHDARTTTYRYTLAGKLLSKTLPDGVSLAYHYNPLGFLETLNSSDESIYHTFTYDNMGHLLKASDENQKIAIERKVDAFGNVKRELFPSGVEVRKEYDSFNRMTSLKVGTLGEIHYNYDPLFLRGVARLSPKGKVLYTHTYNHYDLGGNLLSESLIADLGHVEHTINLSGLTETLSSPYLTQTCSYDPAGNLLRNEIDSKENTYAYDELSQLRSEGSYDYTLAYTYDSIYNRTSKNAYPSKLNALNELLAQKEVTCSYDLRGNEITKQTPSEQFQFSYDALNRLLTAVSEKRKVVFTYDPLGRRLSKTVYAASGHDWQQTDYESYLYDDHSEMGALDSHGAVKNLRTLGKPSLTVGIELEGKIFAPILDAYGNILRLVDVSSKTIAASYAFSAFGEDLYNRAKEPLLNPWRYGSKRLDSELGLILFGKRYYDPGLARWMTTDPAGFVDSINLYQYVFNNPFRYVDPNGEFAFLLALPLLQLALPTLTVALPTVAQIGIAAGAALVATTGYHFMKDGSNSAHRNPGYVAGNQSLLQSKTSSTTMRRKKKGEVDETLSEDPLNDPNLEDVTHQEARERGHHKLKDKHTGEVIEYDEAQPGASGHKGHDHYHRPNPNKTGKKDYYLDAKGTPVPKRHEASHLYPPKWVWWE